MADNSETLIKTRQAVYRPSKIMTMMILPQLILWLLESNHNAVLIAMQATSFDIVENVWIWSQGTDVRKTEAWKTQHNPSPLSTASARPMWHINMKSLNNLSGNLRHLLQHKLCGYNSCYPRL